MSVQDIIFAASGGANSGPKISVSSGDTGGTTYYSIAYADGTYVVVGSGGFVAYSTDARTWNAPTDSTLKLPLSNATYTKLQYHSNGYFVARSNASPVSLAVSVKQSDGTYKWQTGATLIAVTNSQRIESIDGSYAQFINGTSSLYSAYDAKTISSDLSSSLYNSLKILMGGVYTMPKFYGVTKFKDNFYVEGLYYATPSGKFLYEHATIRFTKNLNYAGKSYRGNTQTPSVPFYDLTYQTNDRGFTKDFTKVTYDGLTFSDATLIYNFNTNVWATNGSDVMTFQPSTNKARFLPKGSYKFEIIDLENVGTWVSATYNPNTGDYVALSREGTIAIVNVPLNV